MRSSDARVGAGRRDTLPNALRRLRLRWVVASLTLTAMLAFMVLAAADRPAAPLALAGALLTGAKGLGWLLYLRHQRGRLRRHGYRW